MRRHIKVITSALALTILTGCMAHTEHISPKFGQAVNAAYDQQIVTRDITPGAPVMPAKKVNDAVERYLDDKVKQPKESLENSIEVE